eukprot:CAMPEP_0175198178 /NCGR_PEP_ID=MMETSP0093-20121207/8394_1 /TAXON_ID=311494 /ORGANISM="Alexandrium monilatum, Strain CCMP3105" /LENGTH=448 /DNA_ID=CAMNT_0016491165 /DNA_START=112 /DNA_END=1456 /DNA_ORIENTATION=-
MTQCFATDGLECPAGCGFVNGVDNKAQMLVATAFNERAERNAPKFVLNVGDNFYYGGLEVDCGVPMDSSSLAQRHQFTSIFENVYHGPAPWISALGNHDYGGWSFTNGWDQQLAWTWRSTRWIMPATYFSQHISFPDADFSVDVYVLDTNHEDAGPPDGNQRNNICSREHNRPDASCPGGPKSVDDCAGWFADRWAAQARWLPKQLTASTADWQIVVTTSRAALSLTSSGGCKSSYGLDLLVTGHRHDQELWAPNRLGGLTCFVTGGGGGIVSEASPNPALKRTWYSSVQAQYGFFDLTITKAAILIELIHYDGEVLKQATVYPKNRGGSVGGGGTTGDSCAAMGCGRYVSGRTPASAQRLACTTATVVRTTRRSAQPGLRCLRRTTTPAPPWAVATSSGEGDASATTSALDTTTVAGTSGRGATAELRDQRSPRVRPVALWPQSHMH